MLKKAIFLIVISVSMLSSQQAWSWGQHTHKVVCDIAWRNLTSDAKREVRKLLKDANQKTFAQSCTWPDKIRSRSRYEYTKPHHYINVSESAEQINLLRDCSREGCVIEAIAEYTNILKGIKSETYLNNRSKALMFLGHFVADLHQPLHVGYASDRGGNDIYLRYASKEYSLHYLWDVSIPESGLGKNWRKAGEKLAGKVSEKDRQSWQQGSLTDWGNESLALVKRIYQDLEPNMAIQFRFLKKHYPDAEQRIMMAGVRLAGILNNTFK